MTRYTSAWVGLHRIRNLDLRRQSLEHVVDEVFDFAGGFFEPVQIRSEILEALREVRELRPKYIVEVGTAGGGTLLLWSRVADPEATIVTIDLPGGRSLAASPIRFFSVGLKMMLGCRAAETSVAIAAAAHLAPAVEWADLDGNLLITDDPFHAVAVENGRFVFPKRPGLGAIPAA